MTSRRKKRSTPTQQGEAEGDQKAPSKKGFLHGTTGKVGHPPRGQGLYGGSRKQSLILSWQNVCCVWLTLFPIEGSNFSPAAGVMVKAQLSKVQCRNEYSIADISSSQQECQGRPWPRPQERTVLLSGHKAILLHVQEVDGDMVQNITTM